MSGALTLVDNLTLCLLLFFSIDVLWRAVERYFVLDGNQMRYYRKRGDPAPRGTYVLTDGCLVSNVFNSEEKHKHHGTHECVCANARCHSMCLHSPSSTCANHVGH